MKKIPNIISAFYLGLSTQLAFGATGIYSFDQLNRYWLEQVGHPSSSEREAYEALSNEKFAKKAVDLPSADDEEPPPELLGRGGYESIIVDSGSKDSPILSVLPVLPARAESGRVLRREALVQSYLRRYELFTGTISGNDQSLALERRLNEGQLELYLGSMIRLAQSRTLAGKCQSVQQAKDLSKAFTNRRQLFGGLSLDSSSTWLLEVFDNVQSQYKLDELERLLCRARVITTNVELEQLIKARVAKKLSENDLLGGYAERKTAELKSTLRTYNDLASQLAAPDYAMNVEKLILLRDSLGNVKSNFDLVKDDSYCLSTQSVVCTSNRLDELKAIDFSRIARFDGTDDPLVQARQHYESVMNGSESASGLVTIFSRYENFASSAPAAFRPSLQACTSIVAKYKSDEQLSVKGGTQDSIDQRRAFKTALTQCLDGAVDVFKKSAANNKAQYAIDDALAGYVSRLSAIILEQKTKQ